MRISQFLAFLSFVLFASSVPARAQQTSQTSTSTGVVRDTRAVSLLQNAITAMDGAVPSDSLATGSVVIVAGSKTSQGTITVLTRGTDQTSEQVQTGDASWSVIYSKRQASRIEGSTSTSLSLEAASTSQCAYFPLPYLTSLLDNPDISLQYIGSESLGGIPTQHLRAWNTFQSLPSWQFLSDFTSADIWLDTSSGLPRRISFVFREGGGVSPRIPIMIEYSGFQNFSGVLYPRELQESMNGTPWITISIQSVRLNTGLTDADFPVVQGGN